MEMFPGVSSTDSIGSTIAGINYIRTNGVFGSADLAEQRAVARSHDAAQDVATAAAFGLDGRFDFGIESAHGIELRVFVAQAVAAAGDVA